VSADAAPAEREIWIEPIGELHSQKQTLLRALEVGFDTVVLDRPHPELEALGRFRRVIRDEDSIAADDHRLGPVLSVNTPADVDLVHARRGQAETILLHCTDWKVIPLENLVADFQGTPTRVFAEAATAREAATLLGTLEVGTDGVVLRTEEPAEVTALAQMIEERTARTIELTPAEVVSVRQVGVGDRVCVDAVSLMREGEGMLIGSQSSALVLVQAETLESGYVAARPFRVNAGPVHSYCLVPGGRTRYLAELRAGDEVIVADRRGRSRSELIGRVKIERRPLLLVHFQTAQGDGSIMAQNAETVRLVGEDEGISVAALDAGDRLLVHHLSGARHFGMPIDEAIREV